MLRSARQKADARGNGRHDSPGPVGLRNHGRLYRPYPGARAALVLRPCRVTPPLRQVDQRLYRSPVRLIDTGRRLLLRFSRHCLVFAAKAVLAAAGGGDDGQSSVVSCRHTAISVLTRSRRMWAKVLWNWSFPLIVGVASPCSSANQGVVASAVAKRLKGAGAR